MTPLADALVLTGPTGSGKTALSVRLAERLGAEIVALDSMTLYRRLDIGTAKPTPEERSRVPHHLIDVLEPGESASVAWWLAEAERLCVAIRARGRVPMFVGGTPLYLKALLEGLFESPPTDPKLRHDLEREAVRLGPMAFHAKLGALDPKTAARLHPNDTRRIVRALEVFYTTGRPISELQRSWSSATFRNAAAARAIPAVMLNWPRPELYRRIDARVDAMLAAGWLDECRRLMDQPLSREARQAVGYAELLAHLRGDWPLEEAVEKIKIRTRQFAKRQLTWFRKLPVVPVAADSPDVEKAIVEQWDSRREKG